MDYTRIISFLVEAVKKQQKDICNRLRIGIDIEQPFMKNKYIHILPKYVF